MAEFDIALTTDGEGRFLVHRADCPDVRLKAANGEPVITMLGCKVMPDLLKWHTCLDREEARPTP